MDRLTWTLEIEELPVVASTREVRASHGSCRIVFCHKEASHSGKGQDQNRQQPLELTPCSLAAQFDVEKAHQSCASPEKVATEK